jgi:disulfide bond formation protein DsbB
MSATEIYLLICFLAAAGGFLYMAGFALWSNKDWSEAFNKCNKDWFELASSHTEQWAELCGRIANERAELQAKVEELEAKIKEISHD